MPNNEQASQNPHLDMYREFSKRMQQPGEAQMQLERAKAIPQAMLTHYDVTNPTTVVVTITMPPTGQLKGEQVFVPVPITALPNTRVTDLSRAMAVVETAITVFNTGLVRAIANMPEATEEEVFMRCLLDADRDLSNAMIAAKQLPGLLSEWGVRPYSAEPATVPSIPKPTNTSATQAPALRLYLQIDTDSAELVCEGAGETRRTYVVEADLVATFIARLRLAARILSDLPAEGVMWFVDELFASESISARVAMMLFERLTEHAEQDALLRAIQETCTGLQKYTGRPFNTEQTNELFGLMQKVARGQAPNSALDTFFSTASQSN